MAEKHEEAMSNEHPHMYGRLGKSKNMGLQGIISALKWFQNLLQSKFQKMAEKRKFIFIWST